MLLAVLGVSQVRAYETAGAPLELEVTASRALCTTGSVTDVTWTIRGGVAPYVLAINGQPLDSPHRSPGSRARRQPTMDWPGCSASMVHN